MDIAEDVKGGIVERVARAMWAERVRHAREVNGIDLEAYTETTGFVPAGDKFTTVADMNNILGEARAAIEAILAGQFVEYRITSPDGELFAETAGTPAAAFAEAQHYAMQERGAVIEQVVCLPVLNPPTPSKETTE